MHNEVYNIIESEKPNLPNESHYRNNTVYIHTHTHAHTHTHILSNMYSMRVSPVVSRSV